MVGPTGVFAVETKTHRKPAKGMCNVSFDGETVMVNGMAPDRDPVVQSKAQTKWMSDLLEQSTGRRFIAGYRGELRPRLGLVRADRMVHRTAKSHAGLGITEKQVQKWVADHIATQ